MYQTIGAVARWPTYQALIYGRYISTIKTGNPRNLMGTFWSAYDNMARAFGFLSDVNHYGGYLVGIIVLALAFIVYNRRDVLAHAALFAGGTGLMFSLSRSAWVTLAMFGIPIIIVLMRRGGFTSAFRRPFIVIGLAAVLFLAAGVVVQRAGLFDIKAVVSKRIFSFLSNRSSAEDHIKTRLMALEAWQSSPLIGIGMDYPVNPWYSPKYNDLWGGAHSHHLNVLAGNGILGLALEWSFMAVVFLYMWRGLIRSRPQSLEGAAMAGLLTAYAAILLGNFLYHYYLNDFVWFIMGCGVALGRGIIREAKASEGAGCRERVEL